MKDFLSLDEVIGAMESLKISLVATSLSALLEEKTKEY
tara:strand:- start:228 stop:341 length:114 start_codon:yes stop_codon:yes gene_type:complete